MKKLEKQLKKEAKQLLPDKEVKKIIMKNSRRNENVEVTTKKQKFWTTSKIAVMATACCLVVCMAVGLGIGFGVTSKGGVFKPVEGFLSSKQSGKSAFALSIGSAFQVANSVNTSAQLAAVADSKENDVVDEIEENIKLIQNFLNNSLNTYTEVESDRPEYQHKAIIKINNEDLTIYFNVIGENQNVENVDDDDDDEMDFEQNYAVEGIAVSGDVEYVLKGEKETETEEGETESELEMIIYMDKDAGNYIVVQQEIEQGEQEFEYTIFEKHKIVDTFSIEAEKDEDGEEEYEYRKGGTEDRPDISIKYKMVKNKNKEMLKIQYKNKSDQYKVEVVTYVKDNKLVKEYKVNGGDKIIREQELPQPRN